MEILIHNLKHGIIITIFVFVMMMFVDYINVLTRGKTDKVIKGGLFRQYIMTSFLGVIPGCLGAFMNVSFYIRGVLTFGAIVGGMIATSGDEAFVMLAVFPEKAILLFGILFVLGIISAYFADKIAPVFKIKPRQGCELATIHEADKCRCLNFKEMIEHLKKISLVRFILLALLVLIIYSFAIGFLGPANQGLERTIFVIIFVLAIFIIITVPDHYLKEHILNHIVKKHLWKIFLWSFAALMIVDIGFKFWNLAAFVKSHMVWVLLIASLIAILPESGPHLIFVMMFAKGLIPFSVLLASSIIQDGHGMLPLLSYSVKDFILIKLFKFLIGLSIGLVLYYIGI